MDIRENMLPVLGPKGGEEEVQAIREVIESGWWGKGPKVEEFEERFAEMVGHKYAVAVTSNSHGQDLVMKAMGFKGVDVINPTISFIATAIVPLWNDCTSNIVDVDRRTLCMTPEEVLKWQNHNSEVLIAVNMAGIPCDYEGLRKVFGGFIIEDCAHSCYTEGAGLGGNVAVWSFQAVKTMPCGDGGMITTNDKMLADKCREMTWFGVSSTWSRAQKGLDGKPGYSWDYEVDILGYKYYMIDIIAAICLEQMKKLPKNLEQRRHIQKRYTQELSELTASTSKHPEGFFTPPEHSDTVQYYCARFPKNLRDDIIDYLADKNIHTSVHFKPLHKYEILKKRREYPVADDEWLKLISLPCHNRMTEEDIDYVIFWVREYFYRHAIGIWG